ncbi:MAG: hypothetical protein ACKVXR_14010 [Planctomycetota bacterium]
MIRHTPARAAAAAALLLVLALLPASCSSLEPKPAWIEREISAGSDPLLMDCTALAIQKSGFPVGAGIDPGGLVAVSGWHISLAPFRGKGYREQCEVRYTRLSPGKYRAAIRVRRDKNDDILHPIDVTYAVWVPTPDNVDRARIVLQHINSLLGTGVEISSGR